MGQPILAAAGNSRRVSSANMHMFGGRHRQSQAADQGFLIEKRLLKSTVKHSSCYRKGLRKVWRGNEVVIQMASRTLMTH